MIYSLRGVSRAFASRAGSVPALDGVTFDVRAGERLAVIGPSGAGKTTLFRILNATLRPTAGAVLFDGADVGAMGARELRAARRRVGTIYQQSPLAPSLTALENALCGRLGYWSLVRTVRTALAPRGDDVERADAALEAVGLADKRAARADELSGGQRQRLMIARVLVQDPDVVLADEPFASLDPALTESVAELLVGLAAGRGRTLVSALHDVEMALRHFPRVLAIRRGRVAFDAAASDVTRGMLDALYAGDDAAAPGGPRGEPGTAGKDRQPLGREYGCIP